MKMKNATKTAKPPATPFSRATIERVEVSVLDVVPRRQRRLPSGKIPYGGAGSLIGRPVFVRIHAGGCDGVGEIRPINPFVGESASSMYPVIRDFYAAKLIGRNAFEIESLLSSCEKTMPGHPSALAAIDLALHDLAGKLAGLPVHALLGGACRDHIDLEWSVGLASEKEMVREAEEAVGRFGVGCVCIKIGPTEHLDRDVRTMKAVRAAVGKKVTLGMDANTTYSTSGAIKLARRLQDADIGYFEQPVPGPLLNEMRRVRDAVDCAILADESVFSRNDAMRVIEAEAADVLGLKFYKCGGLHRMRQIAAIADAASVQVNCAGTTAGTYIEAVAAAHLCAAVPNHAFAAEFIMGLPAANGRDPVVANEPIDVLDGRCAIPDGPGLGVVIDEKNLKQLAIVHATVSASGVSEKN